MREGHDSERRVAWPKRGFSIGLLTGAVAASLLYWTCGPGGGGDGGVQYKSDLDRLVLAKIGDEKITVADLDWKIKIQFSQMQAQNGITAVKQKREVLRAMVDQYCWTARAKQKGYDKDKEFLDVLDLSRRFILANHCSDIEVYRKARSTEEEQRRYWEDNPDQFAILARAQASMILLDSRAKADRVRAQLAGGANFEDLARSQSIHEPSKASGGLIGTVTTMSTIEGFAPGGVLNHAIMDLPNHTLSSPVETPLGWAVVRINDRQEETAQPFEEVQEQIRSKLDLKKSNELFSTTLATIRQEIGAAVDESAWDQYTYSILSEDEIFQLAQSEKKPELRLKHYEALVERHPEGTRAAQAAFMIGFTWADDLKDYGKARTAFQAFLKRYPNSELKASAEWMLENMEKGLENLPYAGEIERRARGR